MAVPLVFDPRRGRPGSHPKYQMLVAGAVACAVLLMAEALAHRRPWGGNRLRWPVAGLIAWAALSALVSDHRTTALSGYRGSDDGLWTALALAVVFFGAVTAFRGRVLVALEVLWFGAGIPVLAFGLGQLADRLFFPGGWEWARPAVSPWTIGSTLGNPNHLAAFLAILLPLGVVLAVLTQGRLRTAVVLVEAVLVVELAITASRGGWLAAGTAVVVLGALFRQEVARSRPVVLAVAGGAVALSLAAVLAFGSVGVAKRDVGGLVEVGAGSTLDLRVEVWSAALRVAADHPLVGAGPDVFPVVFPAYASEQFLWRFGPFTVANGAHNLFLNTLANLGAGGLLALLTVLVAAAVGMARAWRRLAAGSERRWLLGAVAAALVAYVVQASFNIQEISLSLCFWVLLGLAVALSEPT